MLHICSPRLQRYWNTLNHLKSYKEKSMEEWDPEEIQEQ